jgi:hypothetical protein
MKALKGILSVCASCKRVRDAVAGWTARDQYLPAHTDLRISHCLCEACVERLYPELT